MVRRPWMVLALYSLCTGSVLALWVSITHLFGFNLLWELQVCNSFVHLDLLWLGEKALETASEWR